MRTKLLLMLVGLLAPLAAFGGSIDYQGAGNTNNGTALIVGSVAAGKTYSVTDILDLIDNNGTITKGNLGTIDFTSGVLTAGCGGFCFTGGTLDIDNSMGKDLVDLTLKSGSITGHNGTFFLNTLLPNGAASVIKLDQGPVSSQAVFNTVVTPEPQTLGLMGTGLLGLGFMRRRFKPGV